MAGSVYAAAVVLPPDYSNARLNDSKQLSARQRYALREEIERDAVAWAVGIVTAKEIDQLNILRASILAMHRAVDALTVRPEHLIVDGNRFTPYGDVPYQTIVKGDGKYLSIAAASVLAKTYRDDYMRELAASIRNMAGTTTQATPLERIGTLSGHLGLPLITAARSTSWAMQHNYTLILKNSQHSGTMHIRMAPAYASLRPEIETLEKAFEQGRILQEGRNSVRVCLVGGQEVNLFYEENMKWFVTRK